ncbi:MAG: hypothetical protein P8010_27145 [Desulfosarcinaceae bacterium]|jgi:hypothetical protein
MKQKYVIEKSESGEQIVVKEYAELDKEMLSLLCQESYAAEDLTSAQSQGKTALIEAIRTNNMYPPGFYADQIADAIIGLLASDEAPATELFFDDKELFAQEEAAPEESLSDDADEDDSVAVDDLLEDEMEDEDEEGQKIFSRLKSSLKMSDDDVSGIDEG